MLCIFAIRFRNYIKMNIHYINREIEQIINEAAEYYSVISVTGPRQSGKSTLLWHLFPNFKEYSMKEVHVREFALNDPVSFLQQTSEGMCIDEIQKAPILMEYIQGIEDHHPERKFLLTGSSNFELMRDLSESLAGRAGVFELLPMSLSETVAQREGEKSGPATFQRLVSGGECGQEHGALFLPVVCENLFGKGCS